MNYVKYVLFVGVFVVGVASVSCATDQPMYEQVDAKTRAVIERVHDAGLVLHPAQYFKNYSENDS